MMDCVKIAFQVTVHYNSVSFLIKLFGKFNCLMGIPTFTKTKAIIRKVLVYDWFNYLEDGLLYHSIQHTRYPQISFGSVWFWDCHPFHGLGLVSTIHKLLFKRLEVFFHM